MNEKSLAERPMEYQLANGDPMKLTINMVKAYLIRGKPGLVENQEIIYFMQVCKARRLNPFIGDCYLIKFSNEPAAIITSVDYFRKNARKVKDCKGWQSGVIVMKGGELRYSAGLVLPGETLLGGWFKAKPGNWDEAFELEVPLAPYIKKKRDGSITKFWREENQSVMIRKIAEAQGLRILWGEDSAGMFTPEEVDADQELLLSRAPDGTYATDKDPKPADQMYKPNQETPEDKKEVSADASKSPDPSDEARTHEPEKESLQSGPGDEEKEVQKDPGAAQDPDKLDLSSPWHPDKWSTLKVPGMKNLAENNRETFAGIPINIRIDFEKKWDRLDGLSELRFPFDNDGNWIGYQAEAQDPPKDENPNPENAVLERFNEIWVGGNVKAKFQASTSMGIPVTKRPENDEIGPWLTYYDAHLKKIESAPPQEEEMVDGDPPPPENPEGPFNSTENSDGKF